MRIGGGGDLPSGLSSLYEDGEEERYVDERAGGGDEGSKRGEDARGGALP